MKKVFISPLNEDAEIFDSYFEDLSNDIKRLWDSGKRKVGGEKDEKSIYKSTEQMGKRRRSAKLVKKL